MPCPTYESDSDVSVATTVPQVFSDDEDVYDECVIVVHEGCYVTRSNMYRYKDAMRILLDAEEIDVREPSKLNSAGQDVLIFYAIGCADTIYNAMELLQSRGVTISDYVDATHRHVLDGIYFNFDE